MFRIFLPYLPHTTGKVDVFDIFINSSAIPKLPFSFAKSAEGKTLWVAKSLPPFFPTFYIREEKEQLTIFKVLSRLSFHSNTDWTPPTISYILHGLGWNIPLSFCEYIYNRLLMHILANRENNDDDPF